MSHRSERINSLIQREISGLLQRQIKDPRLGDFVAITDVEISPDMKHARVFVSRLCGQENEAKERKETLTALESASGFIRRELGKNLRLRHIPELSFEWDESIQRGDRLLNMIREVCPEEVEEKESPARPKNAGDSERK